tara:strand:- start:404 stop:766 length:363 start_codon:yes stop_codon:yes gene_type:complete
MKECTIFLYSRCNTCRKAKRWLENQKINFTEKDIISEPPNKAFLELALKKLDNKKYLINTSGLSYRKIGATAIKTMDNETLISLLRKDPKLIKRPFLIDKTKNILLGFKVDEWENLFLTK